MTWAEPLPENVFVSRGNHSATLFIDKATVENTGYYTCTNEDHYGGDDIDDNEAEIYVFVPGKDCVVNGKIHCNGKNMSRLLGPTVYRTRGPWHPVDPAHSLHP